MKPTKSDEKQFDDLKIIKGIGDATERWLNQSLGIYYYEQLAAYARDKIEKELRAFGRTTALNQIDEWINQARILAANARRHAETVNDEVATTGSKPSPGGEDDNWEPYATFVVEFMSREAEDGSAQQRILCQQNETAKEEVWSGIKVEQLCRWMLAQVDSRQHGDASDQAVNEPVTMAATSPASMPAPSENLIPATASGITVKIAEVRAFQPLGSDRPCAVATPGGNFTGTVHRDMPVMFEVSFRLDGAGALDFTEEPPLVTTEIRAFNRSTATSEHLVADTPDRLSMEDELSYSLKLPESILQPGVYRLECQAAVEGVPMSAGYLKIPFLQVA